MAGSEICFTLAKSGLPWLCTVKGKMMVEVVIPSEATKVTLAEPAAVPEPSSLVLASLGLIGGLAWVRLRRRAD